MDKGVTIREIAEKAGVSTATVSNVIHGKTRRVSPATIRRVQDLLLVMGYDREGKREGKHRNGSRLAALLVNPHKNYEDAIGADPFYGKMIGIVEQRLREKGCYMMFYASSDMDDIFKMVTSREVEGVITLSINKNDCDKIAGLLKRPVVSIDATGYSGSVPNVGLDDRQGGYRMTQYLLECGYDPVYVCAGRDHGVDHIRYMGCLDAERDWIKRAEEAEDAIECQEKRRVRFAALGMSRERRKESFNALFQPVGNCIREGRRPALFCLSDLYALEAMNDYTARKIRIPEELGIAGFDDILYASLCSPGLTTVRQDMKHKAGLAVERLLGLIEEREEPEEMKEILLPVELVIRGSTQGKNISDGDIAIKSQGS